ncbi:hypothetical protein BDV26DRAFT_267422 [Aspergillus bertholletiae]|uniref:Uncharacterized protein n=1 Tax=Aspergillus bertholletiae TaxID=1226010 RepID=A0A5N7B2T7_9EURO|nr:hypothetical protein BDV26DRAFT_267422 [Aspergillus bertholletiae]
MYKGFRPEDTFAHFCVCVCVCVLFLLFPASMYKIISFFSMSFHLLSLGLLGDRAGGYIVHT